MGNLPYLINDETSHKISHSDATRVTSLPLQCIMAFQYLNMKAESGCVTYYYANISDLFFTVYFSIIICFVGYSIITPQGAVDGL